jgi:fermentation-respiration switch protein FrsA (DUF1100 family)
LTGPDLAELPLGQPPRRKTRLWLWALIPLLVAAGAYGALCLWFVVHQREFQFGDNRAPRVSPQSVGLGGFAAVDVRTEDGEVLDAWWLPPPEPGRGVVLFLHGTPSTLADTVWRLPDLQQSRFGVMAFDYRGYGASTGTPSEAGLRADARAVFDWLRAAAPGSKIAVFGESLGTGPAVELACDRPVAGILLNAPYASVRRLFELGAPPLPYRWLMRDQFDTEAQIGDIKAPLMILHGTADHNIPIAEARRLYAAAREPKTMIEVEGAGHLEAYDSGGRERALAALARWTAPDPR